jgi:hypothetical protein
MKIWICRHGRADDDFYMIMIGKKPTKREKMWYGDVVGWFCSEEFGQIAQAWGLGLKPGHGPIEVEASENGKPLLLATVNKNNWLVRVTYGPQTKDIDLTVNEWNDLVSDAIKIKGPNDEKLFRLQKAIKKSKKKSIRIKTR